MRADSLLRATRSKTSGTRSGGNSPMAVAALPAEVSRRARVARSLSPAEWRRAAGLAFVIIALHVVGFGLLLGFVAPQHLRLGKRHLRHRGRHHGLHARDAPRLRRRPHRRDRQHDAQAHGRRPAAAERRVLLLARPLERRLPARDRALARHQGAERQRRERRLGAPPRHRPDRPDHLGHVPVPDRHPQPDGADRHRARVPAHAPRRVRRAAARGAPQLARLHEPLPRPRHARRQEALADVPARAPVRPRLRHRHGDRAARDGRHGSRGRACRSTRSSACRSCSPRA